MLIRYFSAVLLSLLLAAPAQAAVKSSTDKIVDTFMELDADQSDSVSLAEYKAMVNQRAAVRFAEMDANHDGEVSDDEYRQFWQKTKARWYRLKR